MTRLQSPRCYTITIATKELRHWADDRTACRLARRWTRRYFARYAASLPIGSMATAIANNEPWVTVYRHHYSPSRGVAGMGVARIDAWTVAAN